MRSCLTILLVMLLGFTNYSKGQEKKAYRLFDAKGKEIEYKEMMKELKAQDVVFIGEGHNCAIAHWLEYEMVKDLHTAHKDKLTIGLEMLEADNQLMVDEYVGRLISSDRFEEEARLWPNYLTDYAPVVGLGREHGLRVIATNVPRRYANMVKNGGFEALEKLSAEAKKYIAPLPIDYEPDEEVAGMFGLMMMTSGKHADPENVAKAQALKDATMGWFIAQNLKSKFVHLNGNYHSDFKKGIITYLNRYRPGLKIATVCSVRQDDIKKLGEENEGRADFYICVPTDMTMTY